MTADVVIPLTYQEAEDAARRVMSRAKSGELLANDADLHSLLMDIGEQGHLRLLSVLVRAEEVGQTDIVLPVLDAIEAAPPTTTRTYALFRFGRIPASDHVSELVSTLSMNSLRFLFPSFSEMQGADAKNALFALIQSEISSPSQNKQPLYYFNLLILSNLLFPKEVDELSRHISDLSLEESDPVAKSANRIARCISSLEPPGVISRRARPIRTAICISGQLRGYKQAFTSWQHFGLGAENCSVFVHSWTQVGRKYPTAEQADRTFSGPFLTLFRREVAAAGISSLEHRYPSLFNLLRGSDIVTESEVQEFMGAEKVILEDQFAPPYTDFNNQHKMHIKMQKVVEMIADRGSEFDLVVRIRPDKTANSVGPTDWDRLLYESRHKKTLFTNMKPTIFTAGGMGSADEMSFGDFDTVQTFNHAWTLAQEEWAAGTYTGVQNQFHGHETIFWCGLMRGIRTKVIESLKSSEYPGIQFGPIVDPEPIPASELLKLVERDLANRTTDSLDHEVVAALSC